jgi:hypothetical protein
MTASSTGTGDAPHVVQQVVVRAPEGNIIYIESHIGSRLINLYLDLDRLVTLGSSTGPRRSSPELRFLFYIRDPHNQES